MALLSANNRFPVTIGGVTLPVEPSNISVRQTQEWDIVNVPQRDGTVKQAIGLGDVEIQIEAYIDPENNDRDYITELDAAFSKVIDLFQTSQYGSLPIKARLPDLMHIKWVVLQDFSLRSEAGRALSMVPYSLSLVSDDGSHLQSMLFVDVKNAYNGALNRIQRASQRYIEAVGTPEGVSTASKSPEAWAAQVFGSSRLGEFIRQANATAMDQTARDRSLDQTNRLLNSLGLRIPPITFRVNSPFYRAYAQADPLGNGPWLTTGSNSIFVEERDDIFSIMDSSYGKGAGRLEDVLAVNEHLINPMDIKDQTVTLPPLVSPSQTHDASRGLKRLEHFDTLSGRPHIGLPGARGRRLSPNQTFWARGRDYSP